MEDLQTSRVRARGVLLATAGLATALVVMLGTSIIGLTNLSFEDWILAAAATAAVQLVLYLIAARGWDARITFDPHYLYLPFLGALLLLCTYMYLAPELRLMVLLGWFVALLFMAGLGGFRSVAALSALMMGGYYGIAVLLHHEGYPLSLGSEAAITGSVFLVSIYAGIVFERLRAERREMHELRRRLSELALTDSLTGLPNRRRFEEVLQSELDRACRYSGRCTVGMVDVDFFKHYNDAVGHLAGDAVLRELADVMRREIRLHDMVARYGGEEFALIMINAGKREARPVLERLLHEVQEHPFRHRDIQPLGRITVSAGLASVPEDGTTADELLRKADAALYRAKRSGRNRLCLADDPVPAGPGSE